MSLTHTVVVAAVVLLLTLTACGAQATPTSPVEPPEAVDAARQALSQELAIPVDEIETVSYGRVEWPNGCLGLERAGEVCTQVITPGWQVVLRASGEDYVYRTDASGDTVRREVAEG